MNIGVTGGMGSGKSVVSKALAEMMGAGSVSADTICRDLLEVGKPGWKAMKKHFGTDFFMKDGQVDRVLLRKTLFSDAEIRETVDSLLHPLVREELFSCFAAADKKRGDLVAEVPLLFEKGWQSDFDYTVVAFADSDTCVKRIMQRDFVSEDEARKSISSQMPLSEKVKLCDAVIDNSGSLSATHEQVKQLADHLAGNRLFRGKEKKEG